MAIELAKLNNQVWLYNVYFYKLCPHLVALLSGDYLGTFNSALLMEVAITYFPIAIKLFWLNYFCPWAMWIHRLKSLHYINSVDE